MSSLVFSFAVAEVDEEFTFRTTEFVTRMAKRAARVEELREKSRMSGLFGIVDSGQGCAGASSKLISNGMPANELTDGKHSEFAAQIFSSKARNVVGVVTHAGVTASHCIYIATDYSRKLGRRASFDEECRKIQYEAKLSSIKNDAGERSLWDLIREDMYIWKSKNRQTAVKGRQRIETDSEFIDLPEAYRTSIDLGKQDQVAELNMLQARLSAKAFVDQIFADRKSTCGEGTRVGTRVESKPFSDALEVLSTDKDLLMEVLLESNCVLEKCIKNFHTSQTEKRTVKSVLDAKISRCESQNREYSGMFACHCSSRRSYERSSSKRTSLSVGEISKKLRHTFGGTRKEATKFSMSGTSSKLSHSRSIFGDDCIYRGVDVRNPSSSSTNAKTEEKLGKKLGLKLEREPDIAWETDNVRKKIDFPSGRFSEKHVVDAVLEANRKTCARMKDSSAIGTTSERSPKNLEKIISSLECDSWPISPRRDSQFGFASAQMRFSSYRNSLSPNEREWTCLSPVRTDTEIGSSCHDGYKEYDDITETLSTERSSFMIPSTDEEAQDTMSSVNGDIKSNDELNITETNYILHSKIEDDGGAMHHILDSLSENETFTNAADDFPSTPTSIHGLDMPESSTYQQEHESPVSVLDQFFAEDANSPSSIMFQTAREPLKPRRLHFEERSFESSPQDYISDYVHSVFQASSLNWDQLSRIRPLSERLLPASLFDEVEFLLSSSCIDARLLFDHMNEVLSKIQRSRFSSATIKPRICSAPLEDVVLNEIMREAYFYLHPTAEKRTLDQLVAQYMADCGSWLDAPPETEHVTIHISGDILEELILDVILELHC